MLNQVILVGRLTKDIEVDEEGKTNIVLAVPRPYKNEDGIYETDFVKCELWDAVAKNTKEYCTKGDLLGVKGYIRTYKQDEEYEMKIVGERVTFISSTKKSDEETSN